MKKHLQSVLIAGMILLSATQYQAQTLQLTDPFDTMIRNAGKNNPHFEEDLHRFNEDIAMKAQALSVQRANKTATNLDTVRVVFHVVLNANQMTQMGNQAGIIERIQSQVEVLNESFNALNADSTGIPAPFKPLYANMGIHFALAKVDPQGNSTPGYEFVTTTKSGFDVQSGTVGTKMYCSDAKFASGGGADAWDTKKYINVWVINITPSGIGGIGTPPPYDIYGGTGTFPWNEQGVAIAYGTLGRKTSSSQYFLTPSATLGRVLVHELGHFFNLFHPFGMQTNNNTSCSDDDGVEDTPLQVKPTQSTCPSFPLTDACSPNSPGVMYVNYMDYAAHSCALMFSKGQKDRLYVEAEEPGFRSTLFHTTSPTAISMEDSKYKFMVYPNPASDKVNISFPNKKPFKLEIISSLGLVVRSIQVGMNEQEISMDITEVGKGIYIIRCYYSDGVLNKKIIVD